MATKNVNKTRLLMKHDIEANWLKAENFIPLEGEIVVYDADETHSRPRMKIGDGETQVGALPFATVPIDVDELEGSVVKTINGVGPDENGNVKIIENISYSFADATEIVAPGAYTWYGPGTVQEAATKIRSAANDVCVYRMIVKADSTTETYKHTGYKVLGTNEDGSRNIKVFFGDDLCPIILDAVNNQIIADPDWVAPNPTPDTFEAHQMLVTNADGEKVWEDKLCYSEINNEIILSETTYSGRQVVTSISYPLIEGETYTITYNNETYECIAIFNENYGFCLGNLSRIGLGDNTGEPFTCFMLAPNSNSYILFGSTGSHVMSINGPVISYHKIKTEYIPGHISDGQGANSTLLNDFSNTANGSYSIAEGYYTEASGVASHAMGSLTKAQGSQSVAMGNMTVASGNEQFVYGHYNIEDTNNKYVNIVGNGKVESGSQIESNAHTLDWQGNAWFAGDVLVGGTGQEDATAEKLVKQSEIANFATESYVETAVANLVDSSPDALNTLNELAAALGDDPNFATTVTNEIAKKADKTITINGKPLTDNISLMAKDVNADVWWINVRGDADESGTITATSDKTYAEIETAISEGRVIKCRYDRYDNAGLYRIPSMILDYSSRWMETNGNGAFSFSQSSVGYGTVGDATLVRIQKDNTILVNEKRYAEKTDLPSALPNPYRLVIKHGENQWEYNGTAAISVEIPEVEPTTSLPWESITNKPFGEDTPFDGTVQFDNVNPIAFIDIPFTLEVGKTYKTTIGDPVNGGLEAIYTAEAGEYAGLSYIGLGNHRLSSETGEDNGEKYSIIVIPDGVTVGATIYAVVTTHDEALHEAVKNQDVPIKIESVDDVKTLDPKYMGNLPPHEKGEALIPETSFTASDIVTIEGFTGVIIPTPIILEANKSYIVHYNGQDYECQVNFTGKDDVNGDGETEDYYYLGNLSPLGKEDNGLPFTLTSSQGFNIQNMGIYGGLIPLDGSTNGSFALYSTEFQRSVLALEPDGNTKWVERTHYEDEYVEYFPEISVTLSPYNLDFPFPYYQANMPMEYFSWAVPNKLFTFTYNGIDYNCEYYEYNNMLVAGDLRAAGLPYGNDDAPFIITGAPVNSQTVVLTLLSLNQAAGETVTLKVSNNGTRIKKLNKKFMPDGLFYMEHSGGNLIAQCDSIFENIDGSSTDLLYPLEEGKTYTIIIDGVTYQSTCKKFSTNSFTILALGDAYKANVNLPDTDETYLFFTLEGVEDKLGYEFSDYASLNGKSFTITLNEEYSKIPSQHLPDGIFYMEKAQTYIIVPEQTLTYEDDTASTGSMNESLIVGQEYTVVWDDVTYKCIAGEIYYPPFDTNVKYLGRSGAYDTTPSNTDEPFMLVDAPESINPNRVALVIDYNFTLGDHTISVTRDVPASKMPSAHLPTPNWNAAEGEDGYIENRPFYEGKEEVTLVSETTVTVSEDGESADLSNNFQFTLGETYTVVLNGETYQCVARDYDDGYSIVGNGTIYGDGNVGNNEPFSCISNEYGECYFFPATTGEHTISIVWLQTVVHKIDEKFLPELNLIGTAGTGENAEIFNDYEVNVASGDYSHAEGCRTTAAGPYSHTEGRDTFTASSAGYSHAEGHGSKATSSYAHAEGYSTTASNTGAHSEGYSTTASGDISHSEGRRTIASGSRSHSEGDNTIAAGTDQHVQGKYNISNTTYAHIVGNGTSDSARSNAHTLDWSGNAWYQGEVYVGGTGQDDENAEKLVKQSELEEKADKNEVPTNLLNGSASGSLRTVNASEETDAYKLGENAIALGENTLASGKYSFAHGRSAKAFGTYSTATGIGSIARGIGSFASGGSNQTNGSYAFAIGMFNLDKIGYEVTTTNTSFTIDNSTLYTISLEEPTIDENSYIWISNNTTEVLGSELKVGDIWLRGDNYYERLTTLKNSTDTSRTFSGVRSTISKQKTYSFMVGNGTDGSNRSNAHTLDWSGNAWYQGDVYVGGSGQDDAAAEKLVKQSELEAAVTNLPVLDNIVLKDSVTGVHYTLYIANGEIMIKNEVVE